MKRSTSGAMAVILILFVIIFIFIDITFLNPSLCKASYDNKVKWMGYLVINNNDKYWPVDCWYPTIQIGLRDDGIVVWRRTSQEDK